MHEKRGIPCQDFINHVYAENGNYVMALSDGATSAKYAQEAARTTVSSIIQYFENHTLKEFLNFSVEERKKTVLYCVLKKLAELAKEVGCADARQFSATMLFIVLDAENTVCCHLGDGAIFLADSNDNIVFFSEPENMDGITNRTFFSVSADAIDHIRMEQFENSVTSVSQALLTSDGAYLMLYNRGDHDPSVTVKELLSYINTDVITTNEDFQSVLSQMAEVASESMDDWSMIICSINKKRIDSELKPVSMLSEELEKIHNTK